MTSIAPTLTDAQLESQIAALAAQMKYVSLDLYKPYGKQMEFHALGTTKRERLLRAGNQCSAPWSFIDTDSGVAQCASIFFSAGSNVVSWADEKERSGQIAGGILKGIEPAFRLVMEDGRFFDCSSKHQILTESGYLRIDQIMSRANGLRLNYRLEDYQANCVAYGYLYDQQLHSAEDNGVNGPPLQGDVREHSLIFSHKDVVERTRQYTSIFEEYGHLSSVDDGGSRLADLFDLFRAGYVSKSVLSLTDAHQAILKLVSVLASQSQSSDVFYRLGGEEIFRHLDLVLASSFEGTPEQRCMVAQEFRQFLCADSLGYSFPESYQDVSHIEIFYPFKHISLIGDAKIASIVPIGYQPIIDCHVPDYNNYRAAGVYHHNCGKTYCGAAEMAYHLTGRYPEWWVGRRWDRPVNAWAAGPSGEATRDSVQRNLVGRIGEIGTGSIPKNDIVETVNGRGVADLLDYVIVKHVSGGKSTIKFKNYEQGREKWQGDTLDIVWFDEEPPEGIYSEGLTRTNATGGMSYITFTPLLGMTNVIRKFLADSTEDRSDTNMTIEDALHIPAEERQKIINSYPPHERDARISGAPMLGSGRIFPVAESEITCTAFPIPAHWAVINGLDFGWDHPTAACQIAHDRDSDVVYVTKVYKKKEASIMQHVECLRRWGGKFAWPHDGLQHDKGSGRTLAEQYKSYGLDMMDFRATFEDGGNGVEAGIMMMLDRMETGRFKVFSHLNDFFDEYRLYHRKDGKVVKMNDDVISSCLHGDTLVATDAGLKKIADLVGTEGKILSLNGKFIDYKNCRKTRENADLVKVYYSDGSELICTPDHMLFSNVGDWIFAIDATGMKCYDSSSFLTEDECRKYGLKVKGLPNLETIGVQQGSFCTEQFGNLITAPFLQGTISIIKMKIRTIIGLKIWNVFAPKNTFHHISLAMEEGSQKKQELLKKFGMKVQKVKSFLVELVKEMPILCLSKRSFVAKVAGWNLLQTTKVETGFVPINANQHGGGRLGLMIFRPFADVVKNLQKINTARQKPVHFPAEEKCGFPLMKARHTLQILAVETLKEKSDVYCMEVPDTNAFALANGAIVHNCRYGLMMLRSARPLKEKAVMTEEDMIYKQSAGNGRGFNAGRMLGWLKS